MHKLFIIFSVLLNSVSANYVNVERIECYSSIGEKIQFSFDFDSDYINSHELNVTFEIYDGNEVNLINYNNSIKVIGEKNAKATLDYIYQNNIHVYVSVNWKEEKIVNRVRFDLKENNKCFLNDRKRECNEFYKSSYYNGHVVNEYSEFKILYLPTNLFLDFNYLNIENIHVYSNYDLTSEEIYLEIKENINGYELIYSEGYKILLGVIKNNDQYSFTLLEEHYLGLPEFIYTDDYSDKYIVTKMVYFPFLEEYREYTCKIVIKGIIEIDIEFNVSTSDLLFGECENSKYCLERENYD